MAAETWVVLVVKRKAVVSTSTPYRGPEVEVLAVLLVLIMNWLMMKINGSVMMQTSMELIDENVVSGVTNARTSDGK